MPNQNPPLPRPRRPSHSARLHPYKGVGRGAVPHGSGRHRAGPGHHGQVRLKKVAVRGRGGRGLGRPGLGGAEAAGKGNAAGAEGWPGGLRRRPRKSLGRQLTPRVRVPPPPPEKISGRESSGTLQVWVLRAFQTAREERRRLVHRGQRRPPRRPRHLGHLKGVRGFRPAARRTIRRG